MKDFQFCKKVHPQNPNVFLLELDDITLLWGKACTQKTTDSEYQLLEWDRESQEYKNKYYFTSLFSISGSIEYYSLSKKFLLEDAQQSFLSLRNLSFNVKITPTEQNRSYFFKFSFSKEYFESHFLEDSAILCSLAKEMASSTFCWARRNMCISASMRALIEEIIHQPYKGGIMKLFIESKILELFLLQISSFDHITPCPKLNLTSSDIKKIYAAENYISNNLNKKTSIVTLSKLIGLNQTKFKNGFKQLFGNTIYNYTLELRMYYAKKLLEEGDKSLLTISELVDYSHPNHFSYAFKTKFGISPSSFKTKPIYSSILKHAKKPTKDN